MRRASLAPVATTLVVAMLALGACTDEVHVFGAHRYDTEGDCLEGAAAVEVLEGADPGPCEQVRCWVSPEGEIYVTSTACDGPPGYEERSQPSEGEPCDLALAAYERGAEGRCDTDS